MSPAGARVTSHCACNPPTLPVQPLAGAHRQKNLSLRFSSASATEARLSFCATYTAVLLSPE